MIDEVLNAQSALLTLRTYWESVVGKRMVMMTSELGNRTTANKWAGHAFETQKTRVLRRLTPLLVVARLGTLGVDEGNLKSR